MPTFDTPEPIFATIDLPGGYVRAGVWINASDRADTVVEVRPSDESNDVDVRIAEQTRVECAGGKLWVAAPKNRGRSFFGPVGSIDVTVDLPTDSRVHVKASGGFRCEGRLGDSVFNTAFGDIWLEQTGTLRLNSGSGDVSVARAVGSAQVTTANGEIRIREIDGTAVVKAANGDITLGEVTGDLQLSTASGDITVDRALASVAAKTANGSIRIDEVVRGWVALETAAGELQLGIREGTAARLDVSTRAGSVRSSLDAADGPRDSDETVEVRARTAYGDIVIRRA